MTLTKIITYNINGIRSAASKGFFDWLLIENPDIVCLQEIKADQTQIDYNAIERLGYYHTIAPAVKKGYSGVAILSKIKPSLCGISSGISEYDDEGRWAYNLIGNTLFISAYFPSGSSGDERQKFKYKFLSDIYPITTKLIDEYKNVVLSGDFNICHKPIDIHDPISNKNSSGFLPEERNWMDKFFSSGWVDAFRFNNNLPDQYTWWSYRSGARKRNKGWRIDYHAISESLTTKVIRCDILSNVVHSDHCPVLLELDL